MRRAAKIDGNQTEIVYALRRIGASVQLLHREGSGCPDILVGYHGVNYLLEIKDTRSDAKKPRKARKIRLTPDQVDWHAGWRGQAAVVATVDEALMAIGAISAS